MDFSRIPFHSAIERLGHLLPVGAFSRLATIEPVIAAQCPRRSFHQVRVERADGDEVPIMFVLPRIYEPNHKPLKHYAIDGILNDCPVSCDYLTLSHLEGISPGTIECKRMLTSYVLEPGMLSFLSERLDTVVLCRSWTNECSIALADVLQRLGPVFRNFNFPFSAFPDAENFGPLMFDFTDRYPECQLYQLDVSLEAITPCLTFLKHLIPYLIPGRFFQEIRLYVASNKKVNSDLQLELIKDCLGPKFTQIGEFEDVLFLFKVEVVVRPYMPWIFIMPLV